jgi:hypothetical protein
VSAFRRIWGPYEIERLTNDRDRGFRNVVFLKLVETSPDDVLGIRGAGERPADRTAHVIDEHVVITYAAIRILSNTIEHLDDRTDSDRKARFFEHLARDGIVQRFSDLHGPPGQTPFALQRLIRAAHQQNPVVLDDDRSNPDDWPIGKDPQNSV